MTKKADLDLYDGGPKPKSYRLAHNQVVHTPKFPHGMNGFRRFWIPPQWISSGQWSKCPCGWRPTSGTHYAHREHVRWWQQQIKKRGSVEAVHAFIVRGLHRRHRMFERRMAGH
jgi:hypothetical protein